MNILSRHRVRVACNNALPSSMFNKVAGGRVRIYRARAFQLELALFFGETLQSIANFASITAEIKNLVNGVVDVNSGPLATATVAAIDMNNTLGNDDWTNDISQHVAIPFEVSQTGFDMTGAVNNIKEFGLIVTGITTDAIAKRLTLAHSTIEVVDDGGMTSANTPAAGAPNYLTADEVVGLMGSYCPIITKPGGSLTFMNSLGYGIKLYASEGDHPELQQETVYPHS